MFNLFCFSLFLFLSFSYAKESVYEYARIQTQEIDPDIVCTGNKYQASCHGQEIEWIDGVFVKNFRYDAKLEKAVLTINRHYELEATNLNFEGYNLTSLAPSSITCTNISRLQPINAAQTIYVNIHCTLQSDAYKIIIKSKFNTSHPIYKKSKSIVDALLLEHQRFIQPLHTAEEQSWKKQYFIYFNNIDFSLTSHSLHTILFDLYKREQRIANDDNSQNDKNYRTTQDSTLLEDYYQFLQNFHYISNDIQTNKQISSHNKTTLSHTMQSLIDIATKPNENIHLVLEGKNNFMLSLDELETITDINSAFFHVITKILQNTTITLKDNNAVL